MVGRNTHLKCITRVSEILSRKHSTLLTNQQSGREGVAANVVRTDRQIRDLEILDAVDIETLIEHTMLHDIITLARRHGTGPEGVPGGLAVALDPFLDVSDVL
jgi:hypothetical protein